MSGRLILLPKKSYTPWNPENVERVLRDERLDRERKQKEREKVETQLANERIKKLKRQKHSDTKNHTCWEEDISDIDDVKKQKQHFNLFEQEEEAAKNQIEKVISSSKSSPPNAKYHETRVYLRGNQSQNRKGREISRDTHNRIKHKMDPMSRFLSHKEERIRMDSADDGFKKGKNSKITPETSNSTVKESMLNEKKCDSNASFSSCSSKYRKKRHRNSSKKTSKRRHKKEKKRKYKRKRKRKYDSSSDESSSYSKHRSLKSSDKHKKLEIKGLYNDEQSEAQVNGMNSDDESLSSYDSNHRKSKSYHRQTRSTLIPTNESEESNKIIELRKRRMERERSENIREAELLNHQQNNRNNHYHNQYYPALSRRHRGRS